MTPIINEVGEYFISHPSVAEVCVLPRHDEAGGLVAFVVLAPGAKTKREKLAAYAAERQKDEFRSIGSGHEISSVINPALRHQLDLNLSCCNPIKTNKAIICVL